MRPLVLILLVCYVSFGFSLKPDNLPKSSEQVLITTPNPINNHLEVRFNQDSVAQWDSFKGKPIDIQVQIVNSAGMLVYSSTKNVSQFSVFTGGLLNGEYQILCKVGVVVYRRSFQVKH